MNNRYTNNERTGFNQIVDLFLLRITEPDGAVDRPYYTTGSIVAAALLRVTVVFLVLWYFNDTYHDTKWWWTVSIISVWLICVYPAYMQYRRFNDRVEEISEGTLCGVCRHFNPTSQLCMVLDQHVTGEEPPCEGQSWEPK